MKTAASFATYSRTQVHDPSSACCFQLYSEMDACGFWRSQRTRMLVTSPCQWKRDTFWERMLDQKCLVALNKLIICIFGFDMLQTEEHMIAMGLPMYHFLASKTMSYPHFRWIPTDNQCRKLAGNVSWQTLPYIVIYCHILQSLTWELELELLEDLSL